jgi:hypothetical protein
MFPHPIKPDSAGVDFRCLSGNDLLTACKFSIRALDAFCFCPIAGCEGNKCLQGDNQHNLSDTLKCIALMWKFHLYLWDKNLNAYEFS